MTWKDTVLEVIQKRKGREITLQDIYKEVLILPIITEYNKEPWKPGKQPRYQCWIRNVLFDLIKEGSIIRTKKFVYKFI